MISSALRERLRIVALRVLFVVGIAAIIFALAMLAAGCQTTAARGLTAIFQQRQFTQNTRQVCSSDPTVLAVADLALVLLVREAVRAGVVPSYEEAARRLGGRQIAACLVEEPEPCCVGSRCAQGSRGPDMTPKAGCAGPGDGWFWVSRHWPAGSPYAWGGQIVHELGHAIAIRLGVHQQPDHHDAWAQVEARALAAFAAAVAP